MRLVMFTNYLDPQIVPLCKTLDSLSDHQFILAATDPFPDELVQNGYEDYNVLPFVRRLYENDNLESELISGSDAVITAHCPARIYESAVKQNIPVFRICQHIYRNGDIAHIPLKMKASYYLKHTVALRNKPVYLLCLGTYTAQDYSFTGSYKGKMFEFGEFPDVIEYDENDLLMAKSVNPCTVLWVNRFEEGSHPEVFLELAKNLDSKACEIEMIGTGPLFDAFKARVEEECPNVTLNSSMKYEAVNEHLKKASIFVMTSDYTEGWGNILNRAMNHGCAAIVSSAVGSNKMIRQFENGILYQNGNTKDLIEKTKYLLQHANLQKTYGLNAYHTLLQHWNGVLAGKRLYQLIDSLIHDEVCPFSDGLCSPAVVMNQEKMKEIAAMPFPG